MPTYEYLCSICRQVTEIEASISEKEKGLQVVCPQCGSRKLTRVFGGFSILSSAENKSTPPQCGPGCGPGCGS